METNPSKTQRIETHFFELRKELKDRFDRIESKIEPIPLITRDVSDHREKIKEIEGDVKSLSKEVNMAKGISAGIGGLSGFLASLFRH